MIRAKYLDQGNLPLEEAGMVRRIVKMRTANMNRSEKVSKFKITFKNTDSYIVYNIPPVAMLISLVVVEPDLV